MKKAVILIASLAIAGMLLTSCGSSQECPAYSQVENANIAGSELA